MVTYVGRSAWTSTKPGGASLTGSKLLGLAVHWPGSTTDRFGVETPAEVASRLRGWRAFHVRDRGWSDIGYNVAIDQAGRVWELRGIGRVGAHSASDANSDANHEWVGVLLVLGEREQPTTAMIQAFRHFRTTRFLRRWPGRNAVRGHTQVPGAQTSCPGPAALALIASGAFAGAPRPTQPTEDVFNMAELGVDDLKKAVREVIDGCLDEVSDAILQREYLEYGDPDRDGKRRKRSVADVIYSIERDVREIKEETR